MEKACENRLIWRDEKNIYFYKVFIVNTLKVKTK